MNLSKEIISFKRNLFLFFEGEQDNYNGNFKTRASGNYDNVLIWLAQLVTGDWVLAPNKPNSTSNIFIEQGHTVTLTGNEDCLNFNFFNGEALNKINTGAFVLSIYGTLRRYTGSAPGTTITSAGGNGTTQWILGTITLKGNTRSQTVESFVSASNLYGFTTNISLNAGETFSMLASTSLSVNFGGILNVNTGTLLVQEAQIRTSLTITSNGVQDGSVIINNTGVIIWQGSLTGQMVCKAATTANGAFNLHVGGSFKDRCTIANRIKSITNILSGDFYLDLNGNQTFPAIADTLTPALTFQNVFLQGSGNKTMIANVTINGRLSFNQTAILLLGGFVLNYGSIGNLEILANKTRGSELPASSSGANICKDLIIPTGVNYNLGGATVNIRGVLTGGGTVSNGTLNQNQP